MIITFTDITQEIPEEFYPKPSSFFIPDWYKEMSSYMTEKKDLTPGNTTSGTIKKCMPVFDAITAGYILVTSVDVWISKKMSDNGEIEFYYQWSDSNAVQFHPIEQAPTYPKRNGHISSYPKWTNNWSIKTPKGYSTLFTQPMHRKSPFTILEGIVDTDEYTPPVNFPFVLNDISFEGLIPAGTPMVQVIPFKRDNWKMELGKEKNILEQTKMAKKLKSRFFDSYKNQFRKSKVYK
jgi:hypothetical protein